MLQKKIPNNLFPSGSLLVLGSFYRLFKVTLETVYMSIGIITGKNHNNLVNTKHFDWKKLSLGDTQQQTFKKKVNILTVPRKAKVFDCALVFPVPIIQVWTIKMNRKEGREIIFHILRDRLKIFSGCFFTKYSSLCY